MRVAVRASLGAVRTSLWAAVPLLVVLLLLVIVRLPWNGDLGMHAATVERLRHHLLDPGNPLVDADTPSPYYSPWTVLLGCVAKVTGLSVFVVLRLGAVVGLGLLVTGIWRYARTLSGHRFAPPLAVLCVLFLWGTQLFNWSGFLGLNSLALTVAYPSVFALGLAFHFWALLTRALKASPDAGWEVYLGLGLLWAVILLSHQFTGVVASLGALATVIGARVGRHVWLRLGPPPPWGCCCSSYGLTTTSSRSSGWAASRTSTGRCTGICSRGTGWRWWGWWRSGCGPAGIRGIRSSCSSCWVRPCSRWAG